MRRPLIHTLMYFWAAGFLVAAPPATVSFRNEVMAVISKAGCNAGTCHGNKNGKGGFKLSLRGQDPDLDFRALTGDIASRRINPLEPESSLLLLKPTTQVPHEGGKRLEIDSAHYDLIKRWIASRVPDDRESSPKLERIEATPPAAFVQWPSNEVKLNVRAFFSDGRTRDVTSLAVFEPVNQLVKVGPDGLVTASRPGESTVLVRYLHAQEPVRMAFIRAASNFAWPNIPNRNFVDSHVFAKLQTLRIPPSEVIDDRLFIRRAFLDLLGLLPTREEAERFFWRKDADRREKLVVELLARPEFADFWALKWADLLRVEAHSLDEKGVQNFYHWIRSSIAGNKPVDHFVRELVTARGSTYNHGAANFYRPNRNPTARAKAAAQVFLGARLQCAECHNHPSDRWTQDDYYNWASVFAQVDYKVIENNREISSDEHEWKGEQVVFISRKNAIKNPRTSEDAQPRFLGGEPLQDRERDRLDAVANWLTSPTNLHFARVQVNRIWSHLMGRGLVDPPDDFRSTNPASHPELLDALAQEFINHKYDLRHLIKVIMRSSAYQLSSRPLPDNADDEANYSHATPRRLGAEQLLDCQSQVTGAPLKFSGYPAGMRAAQLPGVRPESKGKRRANHLDQFLDIFGKPPRLISSDTERSCEANMAQSFQMISGPALNELLSAKENRITVLLRKSDKEVVEDLFWAALTRPPLSEETEAFQAELQQTKDRRACLEDIAWGLLNSKDFLYRN